MAFSSSLLLLSLVLIFVTVSDSRITFLDDSEYHVYNDYDEEEDVSHEPTFVCKNGKIIPWNHHCNGDNDCGDESDEVNCSAVNTDNLFACNDGKLITLAWRCDGKKDCDDGSDEENCDSDLFKCKNNRTISEVWRCNREDDCGDWSDEENWRCNAMQYRCGNGKCINGWRVCDGKRDCPDGSDEVPCSRFRERSQCPPWQFRCKNRECIIGERRCLTQTFCRDKSDVHGCKTKNTEGKCDNIVHWHRYPCATTGCYEIGDICDGKNTCNDTITDELNCGYFPCKPCEFQCGNGRCIPIHMVCDGLLQCADATDEWDCGNHYVSQNCVTFFPPNLLPLTKLPPTTTTTTTPPPRVVTKIIFAPTRPPKDCKNVTEMAEKSAHVATNPNHDKDESSSVSSLSVAVCVLTFLLLALALVLVIGGRYILKQSGQSDSDRQVLYLRSSSPPY
ncbi:hypothetical protein B566_EDAN002426 [Ephemera danica]|nr:hypothetical protein B566_EDAN002426 [Ephemera danica]